MKNFISINLILDFIEIVVSLVPKCKKTDARPEQKINDENTISEFLEPSEDNKRIKDINNTHRGRRKIK